MLKKCAISDKVIFLPKEKYIMVDTRNLHLACDLMEMNNEKLEVGI
jgi:hypothetical protein